MGDRYNKHLHDDAAPWPWWAKLALAAFLLLGLIATLGPFLVPLIHLIFG